MYELGLAGFNGALGSMDATHVTIENCRFGLRQIHLGHKLVDLPLLIDGPFEFARCDLFVRWQVLDQQPSHQVEISHALSSSWALEKGS